MATTRTTTVTTEAGVPLRDRLMLTVPETADLSGIPLRNIKQAIRDGRLPVVYTGSSRAYVRRKDLDTYLDTLSSEPPVVPNF